MEGLSQDGAPPIDPDDIVIPEIEITSDPSAFIEAQYDDAEADEEADDDEEYE